MNRKDKAHLELTLSRNIKDNRKGSYKYISSKSKIRENVGLKLNWVDIPVTEDTEKMELLNAFLASVCAAEGDFQESETPEAREKS